MLGEGGEGHGLDAARVMTDIARWSEAHQRHDLALDIYQHLRGWHERIGDTDGLVFVLDRLGGLFFQLGRQQDSTRCYEERLRLQAGGVR